MKQKIKKMLKILSIILIILTLFEFVFAPKVSFATDVVQNISTNPLEIVAGIGDGIVGVFLNVFNIIPVSIGAIIQTIASAVASIGGTRIWISNNGRYTIYNRRFWGTNIKCKFLSTAFFRCYTKHKK